MNALTLIIAIVAIACFIFVLYIARMHKANNPQFVSPTNPSMITSQPENPISPAKLELPQLPQLWTNNPQSYFHVIELLFDEAKINSEHTKFALLTTTLNRDDRVMQMIADAWPSIDSTEPYTSLKTILLKRFSPVNTDCLESFFSAAHRCEDTVAQYLVRLRTLLISKYPYNSEICQALIRRKLLESVDSQTRLALYPYENEPLETLAQHADSILARKNSFDSSSSFRDHHNTSNNNQVTINEMFESRLNTLDRTISNLCDTPPQRLRSPDRTLASPQLNTHLRDRNTGYHNQRSPAGHGIQNTPSTVLQSNIPPCYYHSRFGDRALKCEGPACPLFPTVQEQRSKNVISASTA